MLLLVSLYHGVCIIGQRRSSDCRSLYCCYFKLAMSPKRFKIVADSPGSVKGVIFRIWSVGVLEIRHPNVSVQSTYCNHCNRSSGSLTEVALWIFYSMKKDSQQPLVGSQARPWSPLYPLMWERNGLVCLSASPQSFPSNYAGFGNVSLKDPLISVMELR